MAKDTQLSEAAVNGEANALARLLDNGYFNLYDGVKPATADDAITTQTKLATLRFGNPSAPGAVGGTLSFNGLTDDADAAATGTASWFRLFKSDGTTAVLDGTISTTGSNLDLNTVSIQQHGRVSITGYTHDVAKSTPGY
jgi:hypothetical protein